MQPLGVGVVGCGAIACAVHLPVLRRLPGVRVTAVADPDPAARRRGARIAGGAAALAAAEELVDRTDVEAVVVCSPTGAHAEQALLALAARRHLYLEKPIAVDLAAARRVVEAGREAGVVAAIGFNWRRQPLVARARELVRAGVLGDVRGARTVFVEPSALPEWKRARATGGGVLLDLGSHHIDLVRWLLDVEVSVAGATIRSRRTEQDEAELFLSLTGGGAARLFASFDEGPDDRVELLGSRGTLRIDRYRRTLTLAPRGRVTTPALAAWRLRTLVRPRHEPSWRRALRDWAAAARGDDVELPTLADGLRSLEAVVAAEQAAR